MIESDESRRWRRGFLECCATLRYEFPMFNLATLMSVSGRPGKSTIRWIGLVGYDPDFIAIHDNTNGRIR